MSTGKKRYRPYPDRRQRRAIWRRVKIIRARGKAILRESRELMQRLGLEE